jgi:hypothetical protein
MDFLIMSSRPGTSRHMYQTGRLNPRCVLASARRGFWFIECLFSASSTTASLVSRISRHQKSADCLDLIPRASAGGAIP